MGLWGFFSKDKKVIKTNKLSSQVEKIDQRKDSLSYEDQLKIFNSLGYRFNEGVTKQIIDIEVREFAAWSDISKETYFEDKPFSRLYYLFGWRSTEIPEYNFTENCIWFDLDFFDHPLRYKWFMERMGAITEGDLTFTEISIETDAENYEWIKFKVNDKQMEWKLEKSGYIADHFVQRFSYLPEKFKTKRKFTYYDDGGQQWVIDYATEKEQIEFNNKTGLNREWLGQGNHFTEPPRQ